MKLDKVKVLVYAVEDSFGNQSVSVANEPTDTITTQFLRNKETLGDEYFECEAYHLKSWCAKFGFDYFEKEIYINVDTVQVKNMGVLACNRNGCDHTMCDRYSHTYGYICNECFEELVDRYDETDIEQFMSSHKNEKYESYDPYDALNEEFPIDVSIQLQPLKPNA